MLYLSLIVTLDRPKSNLRYFLRIAICSPKWELKSGVIVFFIKSLERGVIFLWQSSIKKLYSLRKACVITELINDLYPSLLRKVVNLALLNSSSAYEWPYPLATNDLATNLLSLYFFSSCSLLNWVFKRSSFMYCRITSLPPDWYCSLIFAIFGFKDWVGICFIGKI